MLVKICQETAPLTSIPMIGLEKMEDSRRVARSHLRSAAVRNDEGCCIYCIRMQEVASLSHISIAVSLRLWR